MKCGTLTIMYVNTITRNEMSRIEDVVAQKIKDRAKLGEIKYSTTMERADLSCLEWLKHAQEEAMDLAVYLQKLIENERIDELLQYDGDETGYGQFPTAEEMIAKSDARKAAGPLGHEPIRMHTNNCGCCYVTTTT